MSALIEAGVMHVGYSEGIKKHKMGTRWRSGINAQQHALENNSGRILIMVWYSALLSMK